MTDHLGGAIAAHVAWRGRLLTAIDCCKTPNADTVRSDCNCALGKWLYGDGRAHSALGGYQAVLCEHKKFHEIAASVIDLINAGRRQEANASIVSGPFRVQSKTVIIALDNLRRALAGRPVKREPIFARMSLAAKACFGSAGLTAATLIGMAPLAWIAAQAGVTTWQIATAATIGAVIAVPPLFGYCAWVRKSMVRPMRDLAHAVLRVERNDFSAELSTLHRWDEIGEMTDAVQILSTALEEKQRVEKEASELRRDAEAEREKNAEAVKAAAERQNSVVEALAGALGRLAGADLSGDIAEPFPPEYERLRTDFNNALSHLEAALVTMVESTGAIESSAKEITAAADDLSHRTEQQASSIEETTATLAEVTAAVKQSAEGTKHAREVAVAADGDAKKSAAVVRQTVEAMGAIAKSSQQIGQIIGVIDEIAFQTNLLALNAGVEAARAGEAGKGFAVVASEVRGLAQRSAEAAKEIKGLISQSGAQVDAGVELVAETGRSLEHIAEQVAEINHVVADIAVGAQEQSTALQQINSAVEEMNLVTQQNAAMVEESTAAGHSLSDETVKLSQLLGKFRVGRQTNRETQRSGLANAAPHAFRDPPGKTRTKQETPPAAKPERAHRPAA